LHCGDPSVPTCREHRRQRHCCTRMTGLAEQRRVLGRRRPVLHHSPAHLRTLPLPQQDDIRFCLEASATLFDNTLPQTTSTSCRSPCPEGTPASAADRCQSATPPRSWLTPSQAPNRLPSTLEHAHLPLDNGSKCYHRCSRLLPLHRQ